MTLLRTLVLTIGIILLSTPLFASKNRPEIEFFDSLMEDMYLFYGNLHSHSRASDGKDSLDEVFNRGRDHYGLDFYASTDHAEQISLKEWEKIEEIADKHNVDGEFVTLRGFELSIFFNREGHVNIFLTDDYNFTGAVRGVKAVYRWVRRNKGILQFNHPGDPGDMDGFKYRSWASDYVFAMESGNGSNGNNTDRYLPYFQKALDKGWKIAPTNNQDNHSAKINSHRTVAIAPFLTRDGIVDAMRNRRLYSSDDPNMKVIFKYKEHWMGSVVSTGCDTLTFTIAVEDDEPITKLELITNHGEIAAELYADGEKEIFWEPKVSIEESTYFYLKVYEENIYDEDRGRNEQIAVTAPIWFE
ncbi:CehA/McbA family metallohydrolase [Bdellovibrionota bacterium]